MILLKKLFTKLGLTKSSLTNRLYMARIESFILSTLRSFSLQKHRLMSVFFVIMFTLSTLILSISPWYVARVKAEENEIPALITEKPKKTQLEGGSQSVLDNFKSEVSDPATFKPEWKEEEIVSQRTEFTSSKRNKDGTITVSGINYKKDNKWEKIDNTLIEDKNASDSGFFGNIFGNIQSVFKDESTFKVKENDWQARFAKSDDEVGFGAISAGLNYIPFAGKGLKSARWFGENRQYRSIKTAITAGRGKVNNQALWRIGRQTWSASAGYASGQYIQKRWFR